MSTTPGIRVYRSRHDHSETVHRLAATVSAHGATLFTTVDHAANAAGVGLTMPPTTVLVFGNPAVGTPAMLANPDVALDLPSRVLVRQSSDGAVEVLLTDPAALGARYALDEQLVSELSALVGLVESALS